jgi:aldose 1-epimerase
MLRIDSADSSVVVMPECGGAILGWGEDGELLLRHTQPDAIMNGNVRGMSGFPLVPFCNRIGNGRFRWQGVDYQLDRNFGDNPHTIHGAGWQRPWDVVSTADDQVKLQLQYDAIGEQARHWPFPFLARLTYGCASGRLVVTLEVENRHATPAPAGIGLHPYFPRRPGMALQFKASGVYMNGEDSLPSQHTKVPRDWDHSSPITIGRLELDNCFTGWARNARVVGGVSITADAAFRHLQVYTPPGRDYFCVEPVSHAPNALNMPDLPSDQAMHVLEPGESLSGSITISSG